MNDTLILELPILWSAGMAVVYVAWVAILVYKLYRIILGLLPSS